MSRAKAIGIYELWDALTSGVQDHADAERLFAMIQPGPPDPLRAHPCPWCNQPHSGLIFREVRPDTWAVICPRCNAVGPHPTLEHQSYQQAISQWNAEETR